MQEFYLYEIWSLNLSDLYAHRLAIIDTVGLSEI